MDYQELLRNYMNSFNIAEVDGRSILVWRKLFGVEGI